MKQSLQLKLGQHLTMTPQLQQAIRLLQLSTLELQQEIQEQLESNPLLEMIEGASEGGSGDTPAEERSFTDGPDLPEPADRGAETPVSADADSIPQDLAVDTSWDDIYDSVLPSGSGGDSEERADFESYTAGTTTLGDHLRWQLNLTPMSDTDRLIAESIIDAIDADGMLTTSVAELTEGFAPELGIEEDEVLAVLRRVQHFDPLGVGSRDLRECLSIQLRQLDDNEPSVRHARAIVDKYLDLLGARDYATLMRKLRRDLRLRAAEVAEGARALTRPGDGIVRPTGSSSRNPGP